MDDPIPPEALLEGYPAAMASLADGLRRVVRDAVRRRWSACARAGG